MKSIKILPSLKLGYNRYFSNTCFIPEYNEPNDRDIQSLQKFISETKKLFILTGAGISTESGIPDYRSDKVGLYNRSNHRPIQHSEFMKEKNRRKIYWARNYSSWPRFNSFRPNKNHLIFSEWEKKGKVFHHVTQNVDSLLVKAGCLRLTEIHGNSSKVKCMDCGFRLTRDSMQLLIREQNPLWNISLAELAPDNDVFLTNEHIKDFNTPICPKCKNDRLKPEVIFFGDSIPKSIINFINEKLIQCDGVLAVGTSLEVYSAYRIILQAKQLEIPVAILNIGKTRADQKANLKINSLSSKVLSKIKI